MVYYYTYGVLIIFLLNFLDLIAKRMIIYLIFNSLHVLIEENNEGFG